MKAYEGLDLFEVAAREAYRFPSPRGAFSVEDLFSLPLSGNSGLNLDEIAKSVNRHLKAQTEESFVSPGSDRSYHIQNQLDIIKRVIAVKQKADQDRLARAGRKAERDRLLAALESKQQEQMLGMTVEQLQARIAELDQA